MKPVSYLLLLLSLFPAFAQAQFTPKNYQDSLQQLMQGVNLYKAGQYPKALSLFEKYYQAVGRLPLASAQQFLRMFEDCYKQNGQLQTVEALRQKFATQVMPKILASWQHHNYLGEKACQQRRYYQAIEIWTKALRLAAQEFSSHHVNYAIACTNLAIAYRGAQEYQKAEPLYKKAKEIYGQKLDSLPLPYANVCNSLGLLYHLQQIYGFAEALYQEAQRIRQKVLGKASPEYAESCNNLGILYRDQQLYAKAIACFRATKNILAKHIKAQPSNYAAVCNNLGILYEQQKHFAKAEKLYNEGLGLIEQYLGQSHPDYTDICRNLAGCYQKQGKYAQATPLYDKLWQNLTQDMQRNLPYASENERALYWSERIRLLLNDCYAFAANYATPHTMKQMYDLRLFSKSLLFYSIRQTKQRILQSQDTLLIQQYHTLRQVQLELTEAFTQTKALRLQQGNRLAKLEQQATTLARQIAQKSTEFARTLNEYQPHSWQEVKAQLKAGEVAIEIIRLSQTQLATPPSTQYLVLMLTSESTYPAHVLLKNGDFLEQKAYAQYRWVNIAQRGKDEISYRHFWLPIAQQLRAICPAAHKAYVSVDGVYHLISLESLRHPKTGKYLADELDIRLVSNTKDLLAKKLSKKKQTHTARASKAYLFGFPAYGKRGVDNDYAAFFGKAANNLGNETMGLPGTHREIKQIEGLLSQQMACRVFSGIEASETNLKKIRHPRLLHLATHGFFLTKQALHELRKSGQTHLGGIDLSIYSKNPMLRAGLLWANAQETLDGAYPANARDNGILTAHEVSNLTLTNTELVVLSACDTGLGEIAIGQGVYGLQRAFLQAGAQALLMTLWEIDDAVTPWFMRYFYEAWLQHHNLRQAYRTAQKRLRKHHPSPYYWAAFVLVEQ